MRLSKHILESRPGRTAVSLLAAGYIRLVRWTSRIEFVNRDGLARLDAGATPVIATAWHGRLLMLPYCWPSQPLPVVLISRHGDGEMIARTVERMGIETVRGSTSRADKDRDKGGAAALRLLLRLLRDGRSVGLTPDGPRGPRMRASIGTITLARLSGAPLIPISYASSRRRLLRSWDRFHLALPFSRIVFVYGDPMVVPHDLDGGGEERWRKQVEQALNQITAEADRRVGLPTVEPAPPAPQRPLREGAT